MLRKRQAEDRSTKTAKSYMYMYINMYIQGVSKKIRTYIKMIYPDITALIKKIRPAVSFANKSDIRPGLYSKKIRPAYPKDKGYYIRVYPKDKAALSFWIYPLYKTYIKKILQDN